MRIVLPLLSLITSGVIAAPLAIEEIERETPVDFAKEIYPVFKKNCIACHNASKAKAKLNLESPDAILKGSSSGEVVVPGKPMESLLLIASAHMDEELIMPPEGNKSNAVDLTPTELGLLKRWIAEGAKGEAPFAGVAAPEWQPLASNLKSIFATAVSPDKRFVACGRGNRIFVYELASGELAAELKDPAIGQAHHDVVQSLAFSPDGMLASGGFRTVKLWELPKAVERFDAAGIPEIPPALADRLKVDGAGVKILKPDLGAEERTINHGTKVVAAVSDAQAQRLATLGEAGKVKLWEFSTGKPLGDLAVGASDELKLAAGERALKAADAVLAVRKKQLEAAEKKVGEESEKSKKSVQALAAAEADLATKLDAFKLAQEAKGAGDREVAAKEAAKHPQLNAAKEQVKKLTDEANKKAGELDTAKRALTNATRNRELALRFSKRAGESRAGAIDALAAAEAEQAARTAALDQAKKAVEAAKAGAKFSALAFSPDGKWLIGADEGGRLFCWAARDGGQVGTIGNHGSKVDSLRFLEGGALVAAGGRVWESRPAWRLTRAIGDGKDATIFGGRVTGLAFSPDGETLATGSGVPSRSGDLKLWNVRDGALLGGAEDAHSDTIADVEFSPDGAVVATAGMDRVARVFKVGDASELAAFEGHGGHVLGVAWRDDGRVLATAGADHKAKLWDLEESKLIKNIEGFGNEVTAIDFVGLGEDLVTSSGDKNVRYGKAQLADPQKCFLYSVAASADGRVIVAGGDDGTLRVWDGVEKKSLFRFAPD